MTDLRIALPLVLLLTACAPLPETASGPGIITRNGRVAVPLRAGGFEVLAEAGDNGSTFFCAAGDYARGALRARTTDRVIQTAPYGPSTVYPERRAVPFTVAAQDETETQAPILLQRHRAGQTLSVGHAEALCKDDPTPTRVLD